MRFGTSYFNSTLYRKTLGRFWPLWTLYTIVWLFALPLRLWSDYLSSLRYDYALADIQSYLFEIAVSFPSLLKAGVVLSLTYGVLSALAAFGYLYNNRPAGMMHSLPLRREALFATQYLAGLSFSLLPILSMAALTLITELALLPQSIWPQTLSALGIWTLVQCATSLFFFSFAAFCAMFTGHSMALPAFYGILNFLVIALYSLITALMSQFFFGYSDNISEGPLVRFCTPVYALVEACHWSPSGTYAVNFGQLDSPSAVAGYAVAGIILAVLALLVYRYRHIESSGDVVAIALVRPVFKYGVSFCSGLCFGMFTAAFFNWGNLSLALCVLFWAVAGYFAAEMLLKKSFRVFRAWKGALVMAAVLGLLCLSFFLDMFGLENRVPAADQVSSLSMTASIGYPYDSGSYSSVQITDPESITQILALHTAIVKDKARADYTSSSYQPGDDSISFSVTYTMTSGATLRRIYHSIPVFRDEADQPGTVSWAASRLIENRALLAAAYDFDGVRQGRLVETYLDGIYNRSYGGLDTLYVDELSSALLQAVQQDLQEGNIGTRYLFDDQQRRENTYRTDLCFYWRVNNDSNRYSHLTITLTPQSRHVLAVLQEADVFGTTYLLKRYAEQDYALTSEHYADTIPPLSF